MTVHQKGLALVIPLFNEYSRGSFKYLTNLVKIEEIDFIFVNDGSTDATKDELATLANFKNVRTLNLPNNIGKSSAIRHGTNIALEDHLYGYVGYLDGDGAFSTSEVSRLANMAKQILAEDKYQILCSSRVDLAGRAILRKTNRHLLGRFIRTILDFKHNGLPYDTQSGFKIFLVDDSLKSAMKEPFETKWFVDVEILMRLRKSNSTHSIWEEPLLEWRDIGESSISWKASFTIVRDLANVLKIN